ncbi:MAG: hypothetical protein IT429_12345 [Gemmataceae bacterium]|nr:hypothetical protein [Gemmataceae bacterium]
MRDVAEAAVCGLRLTRDLPRYLRAPLTTAAAREMVAAQMATRESRFLDHVDRAIFQYPRSPYLALLRHAGCERGDLHARVRCEGSEGALRTLADRGVYVAYDEFKGRRPTVRGSATFHFSDRDFDSPLQLWQYFELTGGSRGRPTRVGQTLGLITDLAVLCALMLDAQGIEHPRNLFWFGASPAWVLIHLKLGHTLDGWFQPIRPLPLLARGGVQFLRVLARQAGLRIPAPSWCDLREPGPLVAWLQAQASPERPVLVNSTASGAVRIAVAATERGVELPGVIFHCRSEPLTPSRRRHIEQTGARVVADYASVEMSVIAVSCGAGVAADDLHVGLHRHALIERERPVFAGGPSVRSLYFSTLSEHAPKIGLNVELGDTARVEQRDCGCRIGELGLTTHLSEIRSFEKLSTEGTTFVLSDLVEILESRLPERFGGVAGDYQLVEEEAATGAGHLVLYVHPRLGPLDEAALSATLLTEMGRGGTLEEYQVQMIRRAQAVTVRRAPPLATAAGKVFPFQSTRFAASGRASAA